jgi:cysteine desulfurase
VLAGRGFEIVRLPVDNLGRVSVEAARGAVDEETLLVSVQAANNEIGTIQDLRTFAAIAHASGALFHSDAAQALGKIPLAVEALGIDLMSVSAHKVYGPKGIGALYLQTAAAGQLKPIMYGGGQEQGFRPGTLAVPLCVGFGEACRIAREEQNEETRRISALRDRLETQLLRNLPGSRVNGDTVNRLSTNISLTIPGVDAESLALALPTVALSTGAACNSGAQEPSYVLRALGMDWNDAHCTIRIGLGRFNTNDEVDQAGTEIIATAKRLGSVN